MYGQGNYGPQFGPGSETPMSQFQHRPMVPPPPPPPPPFQQGPPASQPSLIQQVPPSIPPHIVPSGPALYQHAPPPPAQQGPTMQVPTSGMLNAGQSYLLPPPPPPSPQQFHGNTSMAHTQQNSQWTHNMHHIPPPVPPPLGPSSSEMCRQSLPPRILPTPSQGQTPHRGPIHLQQPDSVQGTQQIPLPPPPPPPPPTSSFFTSAPFGSFVHSAHQDPGALPPPPPLPSSPPPLPPSPPPPTSPPPFGALPSTPLLTAFDLSCNSKSGPTSNHSGFEVMASDSVNEVVVSTQIRDDAPVFDDYKNFEGMISCEVGSIVKDDLSAVEGTKLDLPPPKPVEEKVVRKIEILCHFIAKNGRGFEDMARQKESGNPEFEFLFGGEPGSEAAVAHEYFERMKKKCILQHEHSNSALGPSDIDTLTQTNFLMDAGVSHSPTDSDMDMEDDITQPDAEQRVYTSFESLNPETVLIPKELDIREQLCASQNADEYSPVKDNASRSSGLDGQEKGSKLFPDHDHFTFGRSLSKVDSSIMNSDGSPSNSDVEKSSVPLLEDLTQSNVSEAAGGVRSEKFPGELVKGASPFRLLQDYASDDSSEDDEKPCLEDVSPVTVSPLTTAGATSLHGDIGSNLRTDPASKDLSSSEMAFGILSESVVACPSSMPLNAWDFPPESLRNARKTTITSIATVKTEEMVGNNSENKVSIKNAASEALQQKDAFDGVDAAAASAAESVKSQSRKEDVKNTSTLPKVDEFGRLVREGASDSDSDESRYTGRRGKRGRSWSRSRSPHDRRRKSPRRRRVKKRSRSRSWSPKKRSRSRSPTYRRGVESGGDKMRWNRGQPPACFDFLRGRCHRGAFCRYVHDIDKSDGARRYRSKHQYLEVPPVSRTSDFHEEIEKTLPKRSVHEQDMPESSFGALKDENMDAGKILVSVQTRISNQDDKSLVAEVAKSERSVEVTAVVQDTRDIKEEIQESFSGCPDHENSISGRPDHENCPEQIETVQPVDGSPSCLLTDDVGAPTSPGDTAHGIALVEKLVIPHPQANLSLPVLQNTDYHSQYADDCSTSEFSQLQKSITFQNQLSVSEPLLNKISSVQNHGTGSINQSFSSQSLPPKEFTPVILPAVDFPVHHLHLPPPPPSFSQGTSIPHVPQLPREHDLTQPTLKFSSLSPHMENCPPYQGSMQNQNSHFAMPPNYSWSLPPPPPLPPRPSFVNNSAVNAATAMQGVPLLQFQQNQLPPRNDLTSLTFLRPYPHELPAHSQVGEFHHHNYSLMQGPEPPQRSLHMKDFRPKTLPMSNPVSQPFGSTGLVGEDHFSQFPVQGLNPPNSFAHSNIPPQPLPSLRDSASRTMQSFPGDNLSSGRFFSSSPQNHTYSQHQRPLYGLQRPSADGLAENLGDYGNINPSLSRYTSDILDKNQPSHLSDFGGSRISNYYNPYASTFDQPLRSKFSSNVFNPEKDMPHSNLGDAPYSLSHVPADGHGVGSLGSRHMKSSPKSSRPADLPRSGSDQYDPLFDSIEPSENSLKKFDYDPKHQPTGSQKLLDVEEERKKDVGVVTVTTSVKSENDEYGETADAEVDDVDNASASNPLDATNTSAGEIEIDQIKTPGKSKKSKDSRSMKLFKVALADFVKEVLKPSWRQGSMSKEAFKTIVKKTIDKVSGAMKSHQIPKSQAKINHYIDSSQRKLTKLVMGYVQKYVKV
ncbi:uncharacterized protein LOC114314387 isoform X1 [Camellia sinensis]|uniref:uncharacterized protein LOC114314387 isoform X1 n=1 Tax=Camellia sinensis TaxID=4442 RepID=UPI001035FAAB|nr:uncharacterized protein LOC114314387 isoform X1 [Camellia sinensis]XP_028116672.1 uncharacterized protein LOC114314387 isoform X1 [Camellia sinensis]